MSSEGLMQNLEKKLQEKLQQQNESLNLLIKQKEDDFIVQMNQYLEKYRQNLIDKINSEDTLLKNKLLIDYRIESSTIQEKAINDVLNKALATIIELLTNDVEIRKNYYNKILEQLVKDFPKIETLECPTHALVIVKEFMNRHKNMIKINEQKELIIGIIAHQSNGEITVYYTPEADIEHMENELRSQTADILYG